MDKENTMRKFTLMLVVIMGCAAATVYAEKKDAEIRLRDIDLSGLKSGIMLEAALGSPVENILRRCANVPIVREWDSAR
jgi:hypothetical protein